MTSPAVAAAHVAPASDATDRRLSPTATYAVAAIGAVAVILCFLHFGVSGRAIVGALFAGVVVYLAAFDLEHHLIPNRVVLPAATVVLAAQILLSPGRSVEWLAAAFGTAAFFLVTLIVYPPGLGMGDVKLAFLLGAALGADVVNAVLLGAFAAAVAGAAIVFREGQSSRKRAIAFAPFLAFGGLVALLVS
jgi:leader peptidase (prepilin peptidase) / N-methyltransferase